MRHSNRVYNLTRKCSLDLHQALTRIEGGTAAWVEAGRTFRELTLAEVMFLRAQQAERAQEWNSPYRGMSNELPGLKWEPPTADRYKFRARFPLLRAAHEILAATV